MSESGPGEGNRGTLKTWREEALLWARKASNWLQVFTDVSSPGAALLGASLSGSWGSIYFLAKGGVLRRNLVQGVLDPPKA